MVLVILSGSNASEFRVLGFQQLSEPQSLVRCCTAHIGPEFFLDLAVLSIPIPQICKIWEQNFALGQA